MRALAVTTATRWESLPDVPTVGETLPGYEVSVWFGIGAPRDTPVEIINKLNTEINAGLREADFKKRFADLGGVPMPTTPVEFGRLIAAETEMGKGRPSRQHQARVRLEATAPGTLNSTFASRRNALAEFH
jgi:tripartite-type tricarboxylate transporter receptor subunit TctC